MGQPLQAMSTLLNIKSAGMYMLKKNIMILANPAYSLVESQLC